MALEPIIEQGGSAVGIRNEVNALAGSVARLGKPIVGFATGDSITFQNSDNNSGLWGGGCYWGVLSWLSQGRIVFRGHAGIPGDTSAAVATRFTAEALAYPADMMFIMAGTNDVSGAVSQSTTIANIVAMIRAARSRGQIVVVVSPPPRGDNAGHNTTTAALNTALKPVVETEGAVWIDVYTPLAASGYASGSANTTDGVHPKAPAVKIMAQTCLDRLDALKLLPSAKGWSMIPLDSVNFIPFADFTSTYTGASGLVPAAWVISGGGCTTSVATDSMSGAKLLTMNCTTGTTQFLYNSTISLRYLAGKTAALSGRLITENLTSTGSKVRIKLYGGDTETNNDLQMYPLYDLAIDGDGYFYGELFVPGSTGMTTGQFVFDVIAAGSCTVKVGEFMLRPVDDVPLGLLGTIQRRIPSSVRTVSANTTLTLDERIFYVDASAGPVTITLPKAGKALYGLGSYISFYQRGMPTQGLDFVIIKKDSSANAVTVQRAGSDTINGGTSVSTTTQYGRINPICVARTVWVA